MTAPLATARLEAGPAAAGARGPHTLDALYGGAVRLLQPARGYRFTLDPVLLAAFAAEGARAWRAPGGPAIDLGTGGGIIPLLLARRFGWSRLLGLELQRSLYDLAARNVRLNGCDEQISLVHGDLRRVRALFPRASFGHVLANPPFFRATAGASRTCPDPQRALARHELACRLEDVVAAAAFLLAPRGLFHAVFPASRLDELLSALRGAGLSPKRLRLVHPRGALPARRALVTAAQSGGTKGGAALEVLPPLILHLDDGPGFSPEVRGILS